MCGKPEHFARACKSKSTSGSVAMVFKSSVMATKSNIPQGLDQAATAVTINGKCVNALVDSCSTESYISEKMAKELGLKIHPSSKGITMAQKSLNTTSLEFIVADLILGINNVTYPATRLDILREICTDVLLGQDFQRQHKNVNFKYGGLKPGITLDNHECCALTAADIEEPSLFQNLLPGCKLIATRSRRYSKDDESFIDSEINRLSKERVLEPSNSPWRAQVVVVKDPTNRHKKRLCVDYSQTINLFTELDAYPLPRIDTMVNKLSKYKVFSTFDLKSAYQQIPIKDSDKKYTAFEANSQLYQFSRIPFGVTNGVSAFQRAMDKMVEEENLQGVFPYFDNITIAGHTQEEHDKNVEVFLRIVKQRLLTINDKKTVKSVSSICVLGYWVGNGLIKPDPERQRPLQKLPPPSDVGSLRRIMGMLAYYSKWIQDFSDKIRTLASAGKFPLDNNALDAFNLLNRELEEATLHIIDENLPFEVECDACYVLVK